MSLRHGSKRNPARQTHGWIKTAHHAIRAAHNGYKIGKKIGRAFRSIGSQTYTHTAEKSARRLEVSQHNDASSSTLHMSLGTHKPLKKHKDTVELIHQTSGALNGISAGQTVVSVGLYNLSDGSQLLTSGLASQGAGVGGAFSYLWPVSPFSMNPYQGRAAGSVLSAETLPECDMVHYHYTSGESLYTNFGTAAAEVKVYFFTPKTSTTFDPLSVWNTCVTNEIATSNRVAYTARTGGAPAAPPVSGTSRSDAVGERPNKFYAFRAQYKSIGYKSFTLQPGDTHKIRYVIKAEKRLDRSLLQQQADQGNNYYKHLAVVQMCIINGVPVLDTAAGVDTGYVTLSASKIGWMDSSKAKYSFPPPSAPKRGFNWSVTDGNWPTSANSKNIIDTDTAAVVSFA